MKECGRKDRISVRRSPCGFHAQGGIKLEQPSSQEQPAAERLAAAGHALVGSVALKVAALASVPVLLVP